MDSDKGGWDSDNCDSIENIDERLYKLEDKVRRIECQSIEIKKESSKAIIPYKSTSGSAGFDLYSIENKTLKKGCRCLIDTGLKIKIPQDYYGRIAPRSGLAVKHGIDVLAGVIDSDYRGLVKIVLINHGEKDFEIKAGDRIAQLIIEKHAWNFKNMVEVEELEDTTRGSGGFGSTGN